SQVQGEDGRLETFDYDAAGNELERTRYDISGVGTLPPDPRTLPDAIKRRSMKSYDDLGRVDTETDPEGHATHYTYDPAGNVLTVTDPLMHVTTYEYTPANRVSKVIRADTGQTQITYDADGNRTGVITPTGGSYKWTYDSRNRVATQKDPLGNVTQFHYDLVGNVIEQDNADGTWVRMAYDPMNRLRRRERSDGTWAERSYDAAGNMVRAATEKTLLTFTYDALNRMSSETLELNGTSFTKTVQYQYDEESNLTGVTDPTGRVLTYAYDLAGELTGVDSTTQGVMVQITRDGYGQRGAIAYGNGTSGTLTFDKNGRPTGIDWTAPIAQFGYTRDDVGAPTTVTESLGGTPETLTITRDALNRPVTSSASVAPGLRSETFGYDLNGNLVNPGTGGTTTFNLANQPVSDGVSTYAYDQRGNQASATPAMGDARQTIHDPDNRITGIVEGSSHTSIVYDALNRPVEIDEDGVKTRIVHAMRNRLVEYDVSGTPTALYTMSGRLDDAFALETGGNVYYLHADAVGSVRAVTDGAGAFVGARQFSLFGKLLGTIGTPGVVPLGYGARPSYLGGSLVDMRARLYDPSLGTFLSQDPLGVLSTFPNPYAYANNRPFMFVDPLGLSPQGPSLTDRLFGALRLVGGLGESALGILGILAPEPLTTVGGVLLTAHGIDQIQAGFRQLWDGEPVRTFTSQGLSAGAELLGADGTTAYYIGEYGDAAIGIALTLGTASGLESAQVAGEAVRYGPLNEGPLSPDIAQTFRSGSYTGQTLQEPMTLYRVIGEGGNPAGSFWTATPPSGPVQSIIDLALDPAWGNTATTVVTAEVPAGTTIYSGFAAAQGGLVGGGSQIYIPVVNSAWIIH
ncbi:MAG TPA: RHS repeat-associated core domain-containing protein, partial [Candidatus Saccharimonadales bacterium]|nr:RHS repeat-associated core domain-containing protein [Candidatus Saccharimonadales bacterium]